MYRIEEITSFLKSHKLSRSDLGFGKKWRKEKNQEMGTKEEKNKLSSQFKRPIKITLKPHGSYRGDRKLSKKS